jgi:hypothetical protein
MLEEHIIGGLVVSCMVEFVGAKDLGVNKRTGKFTDTQDFLFTE